MINLERMEYMLDVYGNSIMVGLTKVYDMFTMNIVRKGIKVDPTNPRLAIERRRESSTTMREERVIDFFFEFFVSGLYTYS
jgi:hypothetical protein